MKRRILVFFILLILIGLTVGMKLSTSPRIDQWLQSTILQQLEKHLHVKASLGGFEKNLFMTRVSFTDVTLKDMAGSDKSISTARLVVEVDPYAFLRGTLYLKSVQLEGISLNITRRMDGSIGIDPLFPFQMGELGDDGKTVVPMKFMIGEVSLINGTVSYSDEPAGFVVTMDDVLISLTQGHFNPKDERDISVRSRKGEFKWRVLPEGQNIELESFRADLIYTPTGLNVHELKMATRPLSLELSGKVPFRGKDGVQGDVSLRVDLSGLAWMLPDSSGEVTLTGSVSGKLIDPTFEGRLSGKEIRLSGRDMQNLGAAIHADAHGCDIRDIALQYRNEHIDGTLLLTFKRGLHYTLVADAHNYPLNKLAGEIHSTDFPLGGDVSTSLRVSGNLSGEASSLSMTGEMRLPVGDENVIPARFSMTGQYMSGNLENLDLEVLADNFRLEMRGSLASEGPDLRADMVQNDFHSLNDIPALSSLSGSFQLGAEVSGPWDDVRARVDATARQVKWKHYSTDTIRVHLDVTGQGISLPMVSVEAGSSTLVGRADIPWDRKTRGYRFAMEITDGRVEDILIAAGVDPVVTGRIMGRVEASLNADGWQGRAESLIYNGEVLEESFDEISLTGVLRDGGISFRKLDIVKEDRRVQGKGRIKEGRFEASFKSIDPVLLESVVYLRKLKVFLTGDVGMETTVGGNIDGTDLYLETDLSWDQITFDGRTWQGGYADFKIRDRQLTGEGNLLDGTFSALVEVDLGGDFPFSGSILTGRPADRDALNNLLGVKIPADSVSGTVKAEADAKGILKNLKRTKVNGSISDADFWIKGIHFRAPETVDFTYYPETGIRFINAALWSGESILAGTLLIAPGAEIEGNLDGNVDLQGFAFLKPTVDGFSGQSLVQLQVGGTLAHPILNGSIRVRGAECTAHIPFDLPVKDLNGDLEIVGNRLQSDGLTGLSEEGLIHMEGDLILEGFKPVQGELRWKAETVPVHFPEGLYTVNRADITLRFSDELGVLRGTVSMDEGRFTRQIDIDNLITLIGERNVFAKNDASTDRRDQKGDWLTLDIDMETATPIDVDIKLLRGTARGNLHLQGTAGRPVLAGRMEMDEGTIEYRGHSFDVISGSVGFFNPVKIEPAFDFSARTKVTGLDRDGTVTDYTVDLLATGVPEKFKLDLVSSPTLSEIDIVSLLTWGAVGEQAFASRSGLSAAEATLLLTRELKGTLETGVRQLTGFDRVVINPSAVTSSGERTARIQVDKKLSNSFFLTYSTPVLTSAEQEILLKYRISDSFSLIGEQTGEEDYGLDLDFQFQIP